MEFVLSRKAEKLATLAEKEGFDDWQELVELKATDGLVPGICMNKRCDYTTEVEPDQRGGLCEACDDNTVQSILVLAELI